MKMKRRMERQAARESARRAKQMKCEFLLSFSVPPIKKIQRSCNPIIKKVSGMLCTFLQYWS